MGLQLFSFHALAALRGEGLRPEFFGTRSGVAIGTYRPEPNPNSADTGKRR
jgi:hypothetical protein